LEVDRSPFFEGLITFVGYIDSLCVAIALSSWLMRFESKIRSPDPAPAVLGRVLGSFPFKELLEKGSPPFFIKLFKGLCTIDILRFFAGLLSDYYNGANSRF
jgi:hypothetical protein